VATDILSNHLHDKWQNQTPKKGWSTTKKENEETSIPTKDLTSETSFAQSSKDKTCYCCGKRGHLSPDCPEKNTRKKEDWAVKAEHHMHAEGENNVQEDNESIPENESVRSNCSTRVRWSGLLTTKQSLYKDEAQNKLKNCITLDNGSTLSLFSNPKLVEDIRTTETTVALATNAGVKQSNQEVIVPGFGKV
jgi:hypothetical protein